MLNGRAEKYLIVNADDFGLSEGVNAGIIKAHERGVVTSASLMVRYDAAPDAASYARQRPELSVGLHVDLGEWTFANDAWQLVYEVVPTNDAAAIAKAISEQLRTFCRLMGRPPTHLDSHQHVHRDEPVLSILRSAARSLGVVLRSNTPEVRYVGDFYGQSDQGHPCHEAISVDGLLKTVRQLPAGITELGCHPGEDPGLNSIYRTERALECQTLCDPRVRAALKADHITLQSFSQLLKLRY